MGLHVKGEAVKLRPSQVEAISFALHGGNNVALSCPTASGKSWIAHEISSATGRTAIITLSNVLVRQYLNSFPIPYVIGKSHYETTRDYLQALEDSAHANVVLFNPASYFNYIKNKLGDPFDCAIIDEADSCLSLFALQMGSTVDYNGLGAEQVAESIFRAFGAEEASRFYNSHNEYWWELTEVMKGKKVERKIVYRKTCLSQYFRSNYLPKKVVAMSGTLFPSHCKELFGGQYEHREFPSPIPVERRPIVLMDHPFDSSPDGLVNTLAACLKRWPDERPCLAHCTYSDTKRIKREWEVSGYDSKETKLEAFDALEGSDDALFADGATTGLDLVGDKARLNVILRGAFANLGSMYVRKRKALPGGDQWYTEEVLRQAVQASGRVCRTPDDMGTTVIADSRLVAIIRANLKNLPSYFVEAITNA